MSYGSKAALSIILCLASSAESPTIVVMIRHTTFHLSSKARACHLVTQEIMEQLPKPLPQVGMLIIFVQHTSYALSINENYDPDVRSDMESILNYMVTEREPYYEHTTEGHDDMPAHSKCSLFESA